ncbi:unnamed protein product [Caenorhabditis auriculariae]|uniref:Guanine nucleotide-binding protein subunit gamma n=1 Tax=Caenorhabditis auriculariae TaxID=2777116 RepID=A0A8S1HCC8_9PELO|nr:unnamed protein product [Caenorhabditis auriculariae]
MNTSIGPPPPYSVVDNIQKIVLKVEPHTEMSRALANTMQLRREAELQRKKVSHVSKDLIDFCEKNKKKDVLVTGGLSDSRNPYQEKKGCSLF